MLIINFNNINYALLREAVEIVEEDEISNNDTTHAKVNTSWQCVLLDNKYEELIGEKLCIDPY